MLSLPHSGGQFKPREITILEALSATGLRSIRYAKEIPDVRLDEVFSHVYVLISFSVM